VDASIQRHELNPNDDESILKFFESRWKNKLYYKGDLELKWLNNISRYEGFYYLDFDTALRRFQEKSDIPPWRINLAINLALPIVRTQVTKLMRNRPIWDVLPATTDTQNIDIAQTSKKALRAFWYKHNVNYEFVDLLYWLALTGSAFLGVQWDPDTGPELELTFKDFVNPKALPPVSHPEFELAWASALQQAQAKFEAFVQYNKSNILPLGDIELSTPTPFDMVFPFSTTFEKIPWCIRAEIKDESWYAERGFDTESLKPPTPSESRYLYYNRRIWNMVFWSKGQSTTSTMSDDRDVLELQCWLPKSRQFPKGFYAIIAGGRVLAKGINPYNHGRLPYVMFSGEKTPGKIWASCNLEHAIPLIEQNNRTVSQILEIKNMMGKPKWLAPRSAALLTKAIDSEPGEVIEFSGLSAPQPYHPPPIPRYIFDIMSVLKSHTDDIVAQRDATRGVNPAGVRSAMALDNLQNQDEGQLAVIGLNLDTGMSIVGRMILTLLDQFVDEQRVATYVGEKSRFESIQIGRGKLSGPKDGMIGIDYFNVRVTQFSQFGLSRAGQLEFLKVLLQYNIYTPNDKDKILHFISMGNWEDEIDEYKLDRSNAYQENLIMSQGQMIPPKMADHHQTHLEEHELFQKGDIYKQLPPQIQMIHLQHLRLTKFMMYSKLQEPVILGLKAKIMLAAQEQIPLPLILGMPNAQKSQ